MSAKKRRVKRKIARFVRILTTIASGYIEYGPGHRDYVQCQVIGRKLTAMGYEQRARAAIKHLKA